MAQAVEEASFVLGLVFGAQCPSTLWAALPPSAWAARWAWAASITSPACWRRRAKMVMTRAASASLPCVMYWSAWAWKRYAVIRPERHLHVRLDGRDLSGAVCRRLDDLIEPLDLAATRTRRPVGGLETGRLEHAGAGSERPLDRAADSHMTAATFRGRAADKPPRYTVIGPTGMDAAVAASELVGTAKTSAMSGARRVTRAMRTPSVGWRVRRMPAARVARRRCTTCSKRSCSSRGRST